MHDVTFAKEIIAALKDKRASLPHGARIERVRVALSPLCHVTARSLEETFRAMATDPSDRDVRLSISPLSITMKCASCASVFPIDRPTFACARCGAPDIGIESSREFAILSVDTAEGAA